MSDNKSFTLIELLVVISIVGLLSSIIIVSLKEAREKAEQAKTLQFADSIRASLQDSIIGWWHFDENSGTITKDSWNKNDLNLSGSWTEGIQGSAYSFSGSGWSQTIFSQAIGKAVTYSFWFRLPDTSDLSGSFFCTEDASDSSLEDNLGQTGYGNKACSLSWANSSFNISDTNWHHFVFSKSSGSKLCLDGECLTLGDATDNIPDIKRLVFNGGCGCGYGNFSQGIIIDELVIYGKAF